MTEEMMVARFEELASVDGYSAWYKCEEKWELYETQLIAEGFDANMVYDFFIEMACDL